MKDEGPDPDRRPPADAPTRTHWGEATQGAGSEAPSSLAPGETFGRFLIGRLLGRGGMGEVFEAEDLDSGRRVALKILTRPALSQAERSRFLREGRLAASVNHPNCVYVFGTDEIDGHPVIAMELVPLGTLRDRIAERGPLDPRAAVDSILQVIAGLAAAHAVGVLHRDVKPSNCFLDAQGDVKVGDFGLSVSAFGREDETQLTVAGTFLGTPAFASPEQLRGESLDVRSDIYAVGATLYYLLTGRPPFEQTNPVTLVAAILQAEPESPAEVRGSVPDGLGRIVLRCLAKNASARFQSYDELEAALAPFASAKQAPAEPRIRVLAWLIDFAPWFAANMLMVYLGGEYSFRASGSIASLSAYWLYFALTEGLWGASLGKRLLGLRVVGPDGHVVGPARAMLRAALFAVVPAAPRLVTQFTLDGPVEFLAFMGTALGQLVAWSPLALMLSLFVTARRSNGFAGLHELASGTRVLRRPGSIARPAVESRAFGFPAPTGASTAGPYEIVGALDGGAVLIGLDRALGRPVWIQRSSPGDPAVPPARRDLDRPGRLRWLSGRRTPGESWDAFEAPSGAPLGEVVERPQPWGAVRHWLLDIAEELDAGARDRTLPREIGLGHAWVTSDGRAKLIDFRVAPRGASFALHESDPTEPAAALALLHGIALSALRGRDAMTAGSVDGAPDFPLPLHARTFLSDLSSKRIPDLPAAVARLRKLAGAPAEVTPSRRLGHLACANVPLLILLVPAVVGVHLAVDPSGLAVRSEVAELEICMDALSESDPAVKPEALEPYVAGRFGHFAALLGGPKGALGTDTGVAGIMATNMLRQSLLAALDEAQQSRLLAIVARHGSPPPEAMREAEAGLGDEFLARLEKARVKKLERTDPDLPTALVGFVGSLIICLWSACLALAGTVFRGGPLLHAFGIAAVTRSGAQAGRLRLLGRGLALWLPSGLCLLAAWKWLSLVPKHTLPAELRWAELAVLAAVPLALVLWSAIRPTRGPHDRVAGTHLVPR